MPARDAESVEVIEGSSVRDAVPSGPYRLWLWVLALVGVGFGGWLVGRASSEPESSDSRVGTGVSAADLAGEPVQLVELDEGHVDALTLVGGASQPVRSTSPTRLWLTLRDGRPLALLDRSPFRGCRVVHAEDVTVPSRGSAGQLASTVDGFVDPCHGAVFGADGRFVDGPVEMRGLDRFTAGIAADGEIVVDLTDLQPGPPSEPVPEFTDAETIELTRDVRELTGTVVVAPAPDGGSPLRRTSEVHVVTGFSHASRRGVPLRLGDDRYPLLLHDGWLVLAGQDSGVYRVRIDQDGVQRISDGDLVLPHSEPGWAWVVGNMGWVAALDIVTGQVGPRHDFGWDPVVGTDNGLVVRLGDGNLGFWTAELGVVPLPDAAGGHVLAAAPRNVAVLAGRSILIIDPDSPGLEQRVDLPLDEPGFSTRDVLAAFSPDSRWLVLASSPSPDRPGGLAILDTSAGEFDFLFYGDPHDYVGLSWISDTQFVALRRDATGIDLVAVETHPFLRLRTIARLPGPSWWLAQNV